MVIGGVVVIILDSVHVPINMNVAIIITAVLLFVFILTLSLIRYDALRSIREDKTFKKTNLPLYTDPIALTGHDLRDESEVQN